MPRRVSAFKPALELDEGPTLVVVAAQPESVAADVADDAAPQRVVEVEQNELAAASVLRPERGPDVSGRLGEDGRREGDLAGEPHPRGERVLAREHVPAGRIDDEGVRNRFEGVRDNQVDRRQCRTEALRPLEVAGPEAALPGWEDPRRHDQEPGLACGRDEQVGVLAGLTFKLGAGNGVAVGKIPKAGDDTIGLGPHYRALRRAFEERRIQQGALDLSERAERHVDRRRLVGAFEVVCEVLDVEVGNEERPDGVGGARAVGGHHEALEIERRCPVSAAPLERVRVLVALGNQVDEADVQPMFVGEAHFGGDEEVQEEERIEAGPAPIRIVPGVTSMRSPFLRWALISPIAAASNRVAARDVSGDSTRRNIQSRPGPPNVRGDSGS